MRRNLLLSLLGITILTLLVLLGLNYDRWMGTKVADAPATTEPQSTTTPETSAETTQPAAPATPAEPAPPAAPAVTQAPETIAPTFDVVRVDAEGMAVIAGRSAPGADVRVLVGGAKLGEVQATDNGEWVVVSVAPLMPGNYEMKAVASLNGTDTPSEQVVALAVPERGSQQAPVAVASAPGAASTVLQATSPTADLAAELALVAIDYNDAGEVIFSGKGPASATVRLYVDNATIGDAAISPEGQWTFTSQQPIGEGDHILRLDVVDAEGKVTARVELPFTRASAAAVADAVAKDGRVVIQPGNNLWRIARVIYGDGMRYTDIFEANKDQVRNPNLVYPGQILTTPGVVPPEKIDPDQRDPLNSAQ